MQNRIKDTLKHSLIYSIGNLSTKIIGLILLPLYTSKLSLLNYGKFTILEITSLFMVMVFSLNIYSAMLRWCAEDENKNNQKTIVFTAFSTLVIIIAFLNLILIPLRNSFSHLYFGTSEYSLYFLVLFLSVSFEIINGIPLNLLRLQEKSVKYIILVSARLILVLGLNFYFLLIANIGILGIFLSQLIAHFMLFLVLMPLIIKNIKPQFDFTFFKEMVKYSSPLIFTTLTAMLLSMGDRFIIKYFLDYSKVGIYSLGYKIAGVINVFVIQSFTLSFLPIAYKMFEKPEAKKFYSKILTYFSLVLLFCALGLSLFSREFLEIISKNKEFWFAYKIVPLLCLTFVFKGIQYVFSLGFHYVKKTKYNAYIVICGLIVNFSLNFILVPKFGIWGAGIATVISSVFIAVVFYFYSQKFYFIRYEISKILKLIIFSIALFCLSVFFKDLSLVLRILSKIVILSAFPVGLYFLKFFDRVELLKLREIWNSRLKSNS